MAITTVCPQQHSSNSASDGSMLPLVDGYPVGLCAAILVEGYPNGLRVAILVDCYHNGLFTAMLVD
jgi:hypothetical protein